MDIVILRDTFLICYRGSVNGTYQNGHKRIKDKKEQI